MSSIDHLPMLAMHAFTGIVLSMVDRYCKMSAPADCMLEFMVHTLFHALSRERCLDQAKRSARFLKCTEVLIMVDTGRPERTARLPPFTGGRPHQRPGAWGLSDSAPAYRRRDNQDSRVTSQILFPCSLSCRERCGRRYWCLSCTQYVGTCARWLPRYRALAHHLLSYGKQLTDIGCWLVGSHTPSSEIKS